MLLVAGDKTLLFSQQTCNALSELDSVSHDPFTGLFHRWLSLLFSSF